MVIVNQIEESQEELKSNRRIPGNQKSNKNCIQKKREKENLIKKFLDSSLPQIWQQRKKKKMWKSSKKKITKTKKPKSRAWRLDLIIKR